MSRPVRFAASLVLVAVNVSLVVAVPIRSRPWADEAWQSKVFENSLGMKLVRIEPGVFMMGSPEGEAERQMQEFQHEVAITKPFYMGKFEVTQEEFAKVMGTTPAAFSKNGQHQQKVIGLDTRRFPIETVTWKEAKEFCHKLTERERAEGRIAPTMAYALPTEAEWEYCCRAGTQSPFGLGMNLSAETANCQGVGPKNLGRTTNVGSYPPNAWGLCDMHGNVWEYCEDSYDAAFYRNAPKQDPVNTAGTNCVLRGGGWGVNQGLCRSALRGSNGRDTRFDYNGFRVVLRLGKV